MVALNVILNFFLMICHLEISYSLDYAIPSGNNKLKLDTEFENFYQQILPHTSHLSDRDKTALNTKVYQYL